MKFDPGEIRNLAQIFNNKTLVTKKNFFCNLFWFSLFFLQEHKTDWFSTKQRYFVKIQICM